MLENKRKGFSDEKIECPCCGKPMSIEDYPDIFVHPHIDKIIEYLQKEHNGKKMLLSDFKHLVVFTRLNDDDTKKITKFLSSQGIIEKKGRWVNII